MHRIRRTLLTGEEHLTDRQRARLEKHLSAGDPNGEVDLAWRVYQAVRGKEPSMQNFIVEAIKKSLKNDTPE